MKQRHGINNCILAALFIGCFSCNQTEESKETDVAAENVKTSTEQAKTTQLATADKNKISGNWVRTDAPYNLKIADLTGDGNMKAEYFNPASIHVAKATWSDENGVIKLYVELRDENYPGSNYTLFYLPDRDLLAGKYFQAVESVTYDVGFMRAK
jgi:hypothetical protein